MNFLFINVLLSQSFIALFLVGLISKLFENESIVKRKEHKIINATKTLSTHGKHIFIYIYRS